MKKSFGFLVGVCLLWGTGCSEKDIDWYTDYDYVYVNKCSTVIEITSFVASRGEDYKPGDEFIYTQSETFSIPVNEVNEEKTFTASLNAVEPPANGAFSWGDLWGRVSYTVFSNGEKEVTHKREDAVDGVPENNLYLNSSYLRIDENTFLYAFTDDFFADGEPIEPSEP